MSANNRPSEDEIMDADFVLAPNSDNPLRLSVSSAQTDWEEEELTIRFPADDWEQYRELIHPDNLEELDV